MLYKVAFRLGNPNMNGILNRLKAVGYSFLGKGPVLPPVDTTGACGGLAMATVVKNEGRYLAEWIDFHAMLGVEHFQIYDNGSSDNSARILAPYVAEGLVTVVPWCGFSAFENTQTQAYAHAIANLGPHFRWVGFFDVDEFVFPTDGWSLTEFLAERTHLPAIGVTGIFFGTSGYEDPPDGDVITSYRQAVPLEVQKANPKLMFIKCFVQPQAAAAARSAHYFDLKNTRAVAYSETGRPIILPRREAAELTADLIRYNHYFTRSRHEFERKREAASVKGPHFTARGRDARFDMIERSTRPDHAILPLAARLKQYRRQRALKGAA